MRAGVQSEITVNRYVIEKGLDQQVVLYWYQSHGRVIANEYRSKIFMVYDAARLNRSDAALVRVTSPRLGSDDGLQQRRGKSGGVCEGLCSRRSAVSCRRRTLSPESRLVHLEKHRSTRSIYG